MTQDLTAHEFRTLTTNDEMHGDGWTIQRDPKNPRVAVIRTSDRISFKNCRRRWGWNSHLRHNLGPKQNAAPLWFGSGMHFALEDFHGYNRFGHPTDAFNAYVKATKDHDIRSLPEEWEELVPLGQDMMNYYLEWLSHRNPLKTYWVDGVPQVEVNFRFKIPMDQALLEKYGYDEVVYSGTIDKVCIDEETDLLWFVDYKSAKAIQTLHYQTDPQVSAYMWAGPYIYDKPIGGFIYQQHMKAVPKPGRILKNLSVSVAKDQLTDYYRYRQTLLDVYKTPDLFPEGNKEMLRQLHAEEDHEFNKFIRRDKIYRNAAQAEAQGAIIMMEVEDMLNPNLPLYPNHTRDCPSFCPFLSPCVSLDAGLDFKEELNLLMKPRAQSYDPWRKHLKWPKGDDEPAAFDWDNV